MARQGYTIDSLRVGQARVAARMTQEQAARLLGVNRVTLNKVENGHYKVSLDLLERMATLYDRSRDWLLGEDYPADEVESGRERIATALSKISEGFEELSEVLNQRVREARDEQPVEVVAG